MSRHQCQIEEFDFPKWVRKKTKYANKFTYENKGSGIK